MTVEVRRDPGGTEEKLPGLRSKLVPPLCHLFQEDFSGFPPQAALTNPLRTLLCAAARLFSCLVRAMSQHAPCMGLLAHGDQLHSLHTSSHREL